MMKNVKKNSIKIGAVCMAGVLAAGAIGTGVYANQVHTETKQVEIAYKSAVNTNKDMVSTKSVEKQVKDAVDNIWQPVDKSSENCKDETVYVITDAEGNMQKVIVSEWLNNARKLTTINDATSMKDVSEVKGDDKFTLSDDGSLTWEANGSDIYYQGTSDKALPVSTKISYELDGKAVKPEELAGKSGHLVMKYEFDDKEFEMVEIAGNQEKIYVPFVAVTAMVLDNTSYHNVTVSSGKVINDGSKCIVAGMAFPGMAEDINMDSLNLPEEITVEADVTDCEFDGSYTVLSNAVFNNLNLDDVDDVKELKEAMGSLTEAMTKLMDGSSKLYDGLSELYTKSQDFKAGVDQLAAGAADLATGAASLNSGAESLKNGAASLADGLGTLNSKNGDLTGGASQVFQTLLSTATAQLTAKGITIPALTIDNYTSVLNGVVQAQNQNIYNQVEAGVKANVKNAVLASQGIPSYDALDDATKAIVDAAVDAQMETPAVQQQFSDALNGALATAAADPDYQSLLGLKSQLDSYNQFYQGIQAYTQGVDSAYNGAGQLRYGTSQLADGANTLAAGANTLKEGADTLSSGCDALIAGIAKLKDGSMQLRDGISTFDEEGIEKLSDVFGEDIDELVDRLQAIVDVSKNYNSYAGIKDGMKGSVKFIYKSAEIK